MHFKNLHFLLVGPRDEEMPMSEDSCVAAVLMVDPAVEHDDMRKSVRLLHYGVVKVFIGLVTPSLLPLGPIESTV